MQGELMRHGEYKVHYRNVPHAIYQVTTAANTTETGEADAVRWVALRMCRIVKQKKESEEKLFHFQLIRIKK